MDVLHPDRESLFKQGVALSANRQLEPAQQCFIRAAELGHVEAMCWRAIGLHYGLGCAADPPAAMLWYQRAMRSGSGEAGVRLAIALLHGRWLPYSLPQLLECLLCAARQAHPQLSALLDTNASRPELDPFQRQQLQQRRLSNAQPLSEAELAEILEVLLAAPTPVAKPLSATPHVAIAEQVLSPPECQYLIGRAKPHLQPATVINPHTRTLVRDPTRSNRSAPLGLGVPDLALALSEWRMARLAGLPLAHAEYLAVLCYAPGEEYRPHRDYLNPATHPEQFAPGAPGQRIRTTFVYLNPVADGGATEFPLLDLKIQPVPGRAVVFDNIDRAMQPDPQTLHAGRPVKQGEKWLATLWMRQAPLRRA